jgi:hypothetical protein
MKLSSQPTPGGVAGRRDRCSELGRQYRPHDRNFALFRRSYGHGLTPLFCFNNPHRHSLAFCQIP